MSSWSPSILRAFPGLPKRRIVANINVPDLELFPARYGARSVRFHAGLELASMMVGLRLAALATRLGLVANWSRHAAWLKRVSEWRWVMALGSDDGVMQVCELLIGLLLRFIKWLLNLCE